MKQKIQLPDILISELADDPDMIELIELYIDELPDRVAALERCLEKNDREALVRLAHQIKGSARGYGFAPISKHAAVVEQSAADGADLQLLERQVRELVMLCLRARARA